MNRTAFPAPFLVPGGRVGIIAPSSPFDAEELKRGLSLLSSRYSVSHAPSLFERQGYLAGSDARRLAELQSAIDDPDLDAIFAVRGGYGATRLLDALDVSALATRPKLLVGFSDITALHALWSQRGVGSVHGPMVAAVGRGGEAQLQRVIEAVEGRYVRVFPGLRALAPGRAQGPLLGGNLAVLCSLLGTPFMPDLRGAVLLLEDIGERPYRIDRMLTSLRSSGVLGAVAGILLGAFTNAEPGADGRTCEEVLVDRLASLGVPVLAGAPIGHIDDNTPVLLGTLVELDSDAGTARFC
jgi:muramoyltetrapeptide carboxypeptidase